MNGMMTCVDVTNPNYTTTEDQNRQLEFYWYNDYEFGTDECSANEKSVKSLSTNALFNIFVSIF